MWFENNQEGGATFYAAIPMEGEVSYEEEDKKMRKNKTGEKKNGYTLMILDDDQNILGCAGGKFPVYGL